MSYPIAYSSNSSGNREIYVTDEKGKSKIKITDYENSDGHPAWSPDGKRIASYAYQDGRKTWSIHSMNGDGKNRKRLTNNETTDWDVCWSSDGSKLNFGSSTEEYSDIYIMNKDGSSLKKFIENGSQPSWFN